MVIRSDLARIEVWTKDINLPTTKLNIGSLDDSPGNIVPEDIPNRISDLSVPLLKNSLNQRLSNFTYGSTQELIL